MKRLDVSLLHNLFNDGQKVDNSDLNVEQIRNVESDASIVFNHFGTGVLPESLEQNILFDSDDLPEVQAALLAANNFDGSALSAHNQPSDNNYGNQLEVQLTDSSAIGRLCVKVAIIGLSFDDTLQYDKFYFYKDGTQVTSKHYKEILAIFTNDFKGNNNCSRNLGGRLTIKEAKSFQISLDSIMESQDEQPNIFWRDFKLPSLSTSLQDTIQNGIGSEYDISSLNINTTPANLRVLATDDVTTQIGQKFKARTNNIQKVTLMLSVSKDDEAEINDTYDWSGDLIVSIYALQKSVVCSSDIVPELAIDFDPDPIPLAQLSFNQSSLRSNGYVLNDVPQPVDFIFNNSKVGTAGNITVDSYYAVVVKRSGDASVGNIYLASGTDLTDNSRLTIFSGVWVDVQEEDLWFQVWTDAIKVSDGKAYDAGHGIQIDKTTLDTETASIIDNIESGYSFYSTGRNITNNVIVQASLLSSVKDTDERNGSAIYSRQQFVPSISLISEASLSTLQSTTDPLILGAVSDTNPKLNKDLEKIQSIPGLAKNDTFCVINPDSDLLSNNLIGSKLLPNIDALTKEYKIVKATYCTDGYGDVDGDGEITSDDITRATELIGESIYYNSTQTKINDGYLSTLELLRADVDGDGYVTSTDVDYITNYVNKSINSFPAGTSFTHLCLQVQSFIGRYDGYFDCDGYIRLDGYSGLNIINPNNLSTDELEYDGYIGSVLIDSDIIFTTVPFSPVTYNIIAKPFWQPYLVNLTSNTRNVSCVFSDQSQVEITDCDSGSTLCSDINASNLTVDVGKNDYFVPDNLYIKNGQILRTDGSYYPIDFEIGTIILKLPEVPLSEANINIFEKFVMDSGNGKTVAGFNAMKYADCTTVQSEDLLANRVKFDVSIQSFYPNLDGYDETYGYGVIVDDIIGVSMDNSTGILTLNIKDLAVDNTYLTLVTKIQINVLLKKAGWKNSLLTIEPTQVEGIISS